MLAFANRLSVAMTLAYKVEELLALRDSVSESAVSIDKFADEDVIKGEQSIDLLCHSSVAFIGPHYSSSIAFTVCRRRVLFGCPR